MVWPTCPRPVKARVAAITVNQWSPCNNNSAVPSLFQEPVCSLSRMQPLAGWCGASGRQNRSRT